MESVIVKYLLQILKVLLIGVHYYPLLSAIYINSTPALILGSLYAWLDYITQIINQGMCDNLYPTQSEYNNSLLKRKSRIIAGIDDLLEYYGAGKRLIAIDLCLDIPRYLCMAYVCIGLPLLLFKKLCRKRNDANEDQLMQDTLEGQYVKNLLLPENKRPKSQSILSRIIPTKVYAFNDNFRYPSRVICVYAAVWMLLFFVSSQAYLQILPVLYFYGDGIRTIISALFTDDSSDGINEFPLPNLMIPYVLVVAIATVSVLILTTFQLATIRRDLLLSYRGQYLDIPMKGFKNEISLAIGNFHFAGYFIGYFIWGYILIAFLALCIIVPIDAYITYGNIQILDTILKAIIPIVLFILFKYFLNRVLARYVFLQEYGDVLSINNRGWLMIFLYFSFFLDAFIGFISCIIRIITTVLSTMIFMCRLDHSSLGRKLERYDSGFAAYYGFIYVDREHTHPVLLYFINYMNLQLQTKQYLQQKLTNKNHTNINVSSSTGFKAKQRWFIAYTLIRNPALIRYRKWYVEPVAVTTENLNVVFAVEYLEKGRYNEVISIYL
ncbi:unnamed protein product [Didymodactylos carnosus]|uniref:Receptor for retinol uptake STRA6 n=1 Tax=Didymodactylos carnosus TaxID=1234261 RepID=A0A8S2DHA1_9BILA|nr:unnamed protein product [Didymodactylos carnosus]CAF3696880.1 unnamed protein product [Didymodactylos carnosus]